jgi:hypothetical protein
VSEALAHYASTLAAARRAVNQRSELNELRAELAELRALVTRGSRRRRRGRATSDVPADRPISVAIGDATLLVDVRFGPLCGRKSDICRGPRSARSPTYAPQQRPSLFDHLIGDD